MRRPLLARSVAVALVALLTSAIATSASAAGPGSDVTPPVLRGLTISLTAATPGIPVTVTLDASDDVAVVRSEVLLHEVTSGADQWMVSGSDPLAVTATVGSDWANGTLRVYEVRLFDAAGNDARFLWHGVVIRTPGGQASHEVDLSGPSVIVSGAADRSPPLLTAIGVASPATHAGDPTSFSWSVHDLESTVATLRTTWTGVDAATATDGVTITNPPTTGTATVVLPDGGRWRLETVEVSDSRGNVATYYASGAVKLSGGTVYGTTHDLDFGSVALTLTPAAPSVQLVERPGRLTVMLEGGWVPERVVSEYRVSVRPAGIVRTVAVAPATLLDFQFTVDLAGLPNGVEQEVTVTALSTWGESRSTVRRARPSLARTVHASSSVDSDGRPDVIATRQYGTTKDFAVFYYPGRAGGVRAAQIYRPDDDRGCYEVVPFTSIAAYGNPLCRRDDLVPVLYPATPYPVLGSRGWASMRFVDGGFDLNGDQTADVIAVDPSGVLRLYAQTSKGKLVAWPQIGKNWQSMISVISAGDLNGDNRNDIVAADASGRLWLYPGNGKGGVTTRRQIGSGWQNMASLFSMRDLSGDGKADLGGITPAGELRLYPGTGTGGVRAGIVIGTGWQRYL